MELLLSFVVALNHALKEVPFGSVPVMLLQMGFNSVSVKHSYTMHDSRSQMHILIQHGTWQVVKTKSFAWKTEFYVFSLICQIVKQAKSVHKVIKHESKKHGAYLSKNKGMSRKPVFGGHEGSCGSGWLRTCVEENCQKTGETAEN